jgi:gluconate 5-dehydrogenase
MFRLDGKVALVTGSTRGIGWATAQAFSAAGAYVVVNGRDAAAVEERVAELRTAGEAESLVVDVTDAVASSVALRAMIDRTGRFDILVNNAGVQHRASLVDFPNDEWDRLIATNLSAPFRLAQQAARHMIPAGNGRIINVVSVFGPIARPTIAAYVSSKGGLAALTRSLAVELAPHGVTCNAIAPGYIATEMNQALMDDPEFDRFVASRVPAGRWGRPVEVSAAAVFLASDEASYVNGHVLMVDGGLSSSL